MLKVNHKLNIIITQDMLKQFVKKEKLMITKKLCNIYYIFSTQSLSLNHTIGDSLFLGEYCIRSEKELLDIDAEIQEKIKLVYEKIFNNSLDVENNKIEYYHNYDYYKFYNNHLTDYILTYITLFFKYDDFKKYLPDLLQLLNSNLDQNAKQELIHFNLLQLESPESTNSNLYKNNLLFLYKRDPEAYFNYLSNHNDANHYLGLSLADLNHKNDLLRTINIISIENIQSEFYHNLSPLSFYPFLKENERQQYFGKQYFDFNKNIDVLDSDLLHLDYLINNKMYLFDINNFVKNILDYISPKDQDQFFNSYNKFDKMSEFNYDVNNYIYINLMHFEELLAFCVEKDVQVDIKKHTLDNIYYNLMEISFKCQDFMYTNIKNYIDELGVYLKELLENDNFKIIDKQNYDVSISNMHSINTLF